jgi:hypothetical protein
MKKIVQFLALAVIGMLLAGASEVEAASRYKKITKIVKITTEKVTKSTKAAGLELGSGRKIHIDRVVKRRFKKKKVSEILRRDQIELTNGEIIYPEEVQFALVPETRLISVRYDERAPRGDDERAPQDNDQ